MENNFLNTLHGLLRQHLGDTEFSTTDLCQKMAVSRTQLHRKIKLFTGYSTSIYIRKIRLRQARNLLRTTDLRVSEICYRCGFKCCSWFSQAYKQEFGETPTTTQQRKIRPVSHITYEYKSGFEAHA